MVVPLQLGTAMEPVPNAAPKAHTTIPKEGLVRVTTWYDGQSK
jgi:hypothetical protein